MSKGKQITLDILEQVRDHYLNTLTIDETDRDQFEKVERAIEWVKQATDLSLVLPIQNALSDTYKRLCNTKSKVSH